MAAQPMRNIIAITQISVDGVMQGPGGPEEDPSNGFRHGGWAMRFGDEAIARVLDETVAGEFDMLLGRRTYEILASYWPKHDDNPIGSAFNRAQKYVVTRTLDRLDWDRSERIEGNVVEKVRRLKASKGPEIHIWGSSQLLQTLIAADLVDEYRHWVAPVVLGAGKRLFEKGVPPRVLTLVATHRTPSGVLINTYRPAGPLGIGAPKTAAKAGARKRTAAQGKVAKPLPGAKTGKASAAKAEVDDGATKPQPRKGLA